MKNRTRQELELHRNNVTPAQFLAYVRAQIKKHGLTCIDPYDINLEYWKAGNDLNFNNRYQPDSEQYQAGIETEKSVSRPYQMQTYIRFTDGQIYNLICEFDFWDEKAGFGYFYIVNIQDEETDGPEQEETEQEETEQTEEQEGRNENMKTYRYQDAVMEDVMEYIREEVDLEEYESREDLEEFLNDELWTVDSVTGNASGSYTFSTAKAREYVFSDMETVVAAYHEFCEADRFLEDMESERYEIMDVTARCYVLYSAISSVLDELEESGAFEQEEQEEQEENELAF